MLYFFQKSFKYFVKDFVISKTMNTACFPTAPLREWMRNSKIEDENFFNLPTNYKDLQQEVSVSAGCGEKVVRLAEKVMIRQLPRQSFDRNHQYFSISIFDFSHFFFEIRKSKTSVFSIYLQTTITSIRSVNLNGLWRKSTSPDGGFTGTF